MQLSEFSLTTAQMEVEEVWKALSTVIPAAKIQQAIEATQSQAERQRRLPTELVVALVNGMSLWSQESIIDVLKNLANGWSNQWIRLGQWWQVPSKSAISEARQRVGPQGMSWLFALVARPLATRNTPGAFLNGLRLMAIDGTVFDVPDTAANARVWGYPGSRPGTQAAFPKVRLVMLVEVGTHVVTDALLCPYRMGERVRALRLLRSVTAGMLLMWARGLHSYKMVRAILARGCHLLGRVPANAKFEVVQTLADGSYLSWLAPDGKSKRKGGTRILVRVIEYTIAEDDQQQVYRLITDLLDIALFPALLLAREYHQRWEAETTLDELKTHLNGRKTPIRSKQPRLVVQEIYGWLLAHWAVRCLMFQAAQSAEMSPLRLSFTGTLRVVRRAVAKFQDTQPEEVPFFSVGSSRRL